MVNCILCFLKSTLKTCTSTISPIDTASSGCLMKRSQISEIWTSPSWCTPISTKAPKSMTLRTVPFKTMPGFKSSMLRTSLRRIGFGISPLGSRPGFWSSFTISSKVMAPIPSSSASRSRSPTSFPICPIPPLVISVRSCPNSARNFSVTS